MKASALKGPGRTPGAPDAEPILVDVAAGDTLSRAGVVAQLRPHPEVRVLDEEDRAVAAVLVLVADQVDDDVRDRVRRTSRNTVTRTLLVVTSIEEGHLISAVESGVMGIVRRADASPDRLIHAIRAVAQGGGHLPGDLLGQLLASVGTVQRDLLGPRGLYFAGITDREQDVLRLLAEGDDTSQVAQKLSCSQRTVKHILTGLTQRLNLRNRTQAVAYALRNGLI
ncbi:LuxR C-terminal-related transcriptional regulator [Streptomyces sp. NPDC059611]|uniref:helix-turn-helix transcriptional regulator n=1 Tax=Streptomyces sp. NPDC059611 TaxID=3346884 RepID=UPI00368F6F0C